MPVNHDNCPTPNEMHEKVKRNIEQYGLQVTMVGGTAYLPSFAYSTGLWETYNHPEIICFALSDEFGHRIINDVANIIKEEGHLMPGNEYQNIFGNGKAAFLEIDPENIDDYFGVAINYYNTNTFPALQLVWTDRNDKFPWETGFEEKFIYKQPLLDRNAQFKFRESKALAIYTTRQWLTLKQPILRVVHDNDGDWQFLTGDQMPEDIRLVALEEMTLRDGTLNEIFNLNYGESAERDFPGGPWTRSKAEEEADDE